MQSPALHEHLYIYTTYTERPMHIYINKSQLKKGIHQCGIILLCNYKSTHHGCDIDFYHLTLMTSYINHHNIMLIKIVLHPHTFVQLECVPKFCLMAKQF